MSNKNIQLDITFTIPGYKKARSARISHSHRSLLRSNKLSGHTNLFYFIRNEQFLIKQKTALISKTVFCILFSFIISANDFALHDDRQLLNYK